MLAEVTAREIGRVTIAEALELTALVARKQPHRYGRFAARWLSLVSPTASNYKTRKAPFPGPSAVAGAGFEPATAGL